MTVGLAAARANAYLDTYNGGTPLAAIANVFVKLHTGDPGASGTANASAETDRPELTLAAASGGSKASSNAPEWASWDAGAEALTHISLWTAATAGTFIRSAALASTVNVADGNTLTLSSFTWSFSPIAA